MNGMSFFERLSDFLARHGRRVLAGTALLMILSLVGICLLQIDTRFTVFMPPDSPARQALDEMTEAFGDSGQLVALAETPHEPEALKRLPSIAERLSELEGVAAAEPPVPERLEDLEPASFSAALERLKTLTGGATLPEYDSATYATFRVMIAKDANTRATVDSVREIFRDEGLSVLFSGEPYLEARVFDYVLRILL
jgi:predicted RND superfamily exporter protein